MTAWPTAHQLALSLPGSEARDHFGSHSFHVNGKIFAQLSPQDRNAPLVIVKLSSADQTALTLLDPETFSSPPQWGQHGWTSVLLSGVEQSMLHKLLIQSWRNVAPKKLIASYPALSP